LRNDPLVSIITPSFNTEEYIKDTIESVLCQKYSNFEHIVCDGGSTDNTIDILKGYPHLNWLSESDRGQAHALNKGFKMAKGEIFGWLNSDDTYNPGAIKTAVEYFNNNREIDLIHTNCNLIDKNNNFIRHAKASNFDFNSILFSNDIQQMTVFFRRRVFDEIGEIDEINRGCPDREYWLRIMLNEKIKTKYLTGETFANFRYTEGTISFSNGEKGFYDWFKVLERLSKGYYGVSVDEMLLKKAVQNNSSNYYLALSRSNKLEGKRCSSLINIFKAVGSKGSLLANGGLYFLIVEAILGQKLAVFFRGVFESK
jgi:glycosyltransferase involved in cell wall biosynthesis